MRAKAKRASRESLVRLRNEMQTQWGKWTGWEIDFSVKGIPRIIERSGGIHPASGYEVALWRRLERKEHHVFNAK